MLNKAMSLEVDKAEIFCGGVSRFWLSFCTSCPRGGWVRDGAGRPPGARGGGGGGGMPQPPPSEWRELGARAELWDGPGEGAARATEAGAGRLVRAAEEPGAGGGEDGGRVLVELSGDGYRAFLGRGAWELARPVARADLEAPSGSGGGLGEAAAAAAAERLAPGAGCYLWGGCLGPRYDCSGFVQAAFLEGPTPGVWLPRDAYQQREFSAKVSWREVLPGDLVFFGSLSRGAEGAARAPLVDHVGLCTRVEPGGALKYLHSSGASAGRDGVGEDVLPAPGQDPNTTLQDPISRRYAARLVGFGRVSRGLRPGETVPQAGFVGEPKRGALDEGGG